MRRTFYLKQAPSEAASACAPLKMVMSARRPVHEHLSSVSGDRAGFTEYEAVLLWNFSSKDFPMDRKSAKLLYVAISRPTNQLILVAPGQSLSPFAPPDAVD